MEINSCGVDRDQLMYAHVHSPINSCTPTCSHQPTHVRPCALTNQLMYAHVHSPINSCTPTCTHQSTHVRPRALTNQLMYAHVYSPINSCTPTCTHQSTHIRPRALTNGTSGQMHYIYVCLYFTHMIILSGPASPDHSCVGP